jgi:hypothetical protein
MTSDLVVHMYPISALTPDLTVLQTVPVPVYSLSALTSDLSQFDLDLGPDVGVVPDGATEMSCNLLETGDMDQLSLEIEKEK